MTIELKDSITLNLTFNNLKKREIMRFYFNAFLSIFFVFIIHGNLKSQNWLKFYDGLCGSDPFENPYEYIDNYKFSCITTDGTNIYTCGTYNLFHKPDPGTIVKYKLVVTKINQDGIELFSELITINNDDSYQIIPKGIIYDNNNLIITGFYKNPLKPLVSLTSSSSEGFVLKFNLNTNTVTWCRLFVTPQVILFDIIKLSNGNYAVCGEAEDSSSNLGEESIIYSIDQNTGMPTLINRSHVKNQNLADSYFAMITFWGRIYASGRHEFKMTPYGYSYQYLRTTVTSMLNNGTGLNMKNYLHSINEPTARLYGVDICQAGSNAILISHGGITTNKLERDLIITKIDPSLNEVWSRKIEFGTLDDGRLITICSKFNGTDYDYYVLGRTEVSEGYPFVLKMRENGTIDWGFKYLKFDISDFDLPDNHSFSPSPNSMIILGNSLFVVGEGKGLNVYGDLAEKGALLKLSLSNGYLSPACSLTHTPSIVSVDFSEPCIQNSSDVSITIVPVTKTNSPCSVEGNDECIE